MQRDRELLITFRLITRKYLSCLLPPKCTCVLQSETSVTLLVTVGNRRMFKFTLQIGIFTKFSEKRAAPIFSVVQE